MGKPGPMQTPITARIKRTTQGGMTTQPILNMGAPVKMKRTPAKKSLVGNQDQLPANLQADIKAAPGKMYDSPAKVDNDFKTKIDARNKAKADAAEAGKARVAAKSKSDYDTNLSNYKKNVLSLEGDMKVKGGSARQQDQQMRAAGRKSKSITSFENNLYNYDKKNKPSGGVSNYSNAKDYAMSKAMGNTKPGKKNIDGGGGKEEIKTKKKVSYDTAYKNRDKKVYGGMDKAAYTKEAKRQNANFKKTGKWDVKSSYAKREKVEKVSTLTSRPIVTKKVEITTKLDPTKKTKVTTAPKETSKRASKLRAKGTAQLAAGDKKGAQATRRKYDRKNAKVAKKTKKGTNRVEYDESTGKGGSVLGNALRSVTGKRKRDKAAAERRKNAPGGNMI